MLSFYQSKVAPSVKGVCWMKIVNKTSFEHGAPPGVNEYRAPPGVISAFYKVSLRFYILTLILWSLNQE